MELENVHNIADYITYHSHTRPKQTAIFFPQKKDRNGTREYSHLTFVQVEAMINRFARGFLKSGIRKGDRVCLFVRPCLEFMPLVFSLYKIGAVVVLIDPGMGRKGLLSCVERIAPRVMVGIPQAMIATLLFPKKFKSVELKVTVGGFSWIWGGLTLLEVEDIDDSAIACVTCLDDEASILFTSGSTGPAKGVRYTHRIFDAQTRHIKSMYGIEAGEVDLPCFPLFGLFTLAQGMTVVIPDMDPTKPAKADPALLVEAIKHHKVSNAFASPALWKNLAAWCLSHNVKLPTIKRVLSAGAPISPKLHLDFQEILSTGVEVHTPYGATESLPVATIGSIEVLKDTQHRTNSGEGTCVGHIAPDIEVRIIAISDQVIEEWSDELCLSQGEIGEICVKGTVVTTEYKEEPDKTALAKIYQADEVWHRMGDLGYIDEQRRLWFCGRKTHRVSLSNGKLLFPVPCEAIFNIHSSVSRSALVGVENEPIIIIELEKEFSGNRTDVEKELLSIAQENELTKPINTILFHPSFPVDVRHNAKIHRLQLADWAKGKL
jgi:olefin beta-lactone synthetase